MSVKSGEGKPDPHADYRVNPYSYLAIDGVTGEYSISGEPKEIPKGYHIRLHEKVSGLRTFKVSKDGADTYDIVYAGTMMVQNNFAYISGEMLDSERPYDFLTFVWFPPFAISYPLKEPDLMKEEFDAQRWIDHKIKLIKIILENEDNDITKKGIFDFDLSRELVLRPPLPLKCYTCKGELQISCDSNFCHVCDFKGSSEVENVDNKMVEHIKSEPDQTQREAELEGELRQSRNNYEDLRIKFLDNIVLEAEQKEKIKKLEYRLKEMETEYEAEIKELESRLKEMMMTETGYTSELEAARAAEREALIKAARVTEQLQAAEASLREVGSILRTILPRSYTDVDDVVLKKRRMS